MTAYDLGRQHAAECRVPSRRERADELRQAGLDPAAPGVVDEYERGRADWQAEAAAQRAADERQALADCQSAGIVFARAKARLTASGLTYEQGRLLADCGWHLTGGGTAWIGAAKATPECAAHVLRNTVSAAALAHRAEQSEARDAQRQAERDALADVQPDWPTYRLVLDLARQCRELASALRYGDTGDALAHQHAPGELADLAEQAGVDPSSDFGRLVATVCQGRAGEGQAKALAVGLAKRVAALGQQAIGVATGAEPIISTRPLARAREAARLRVTMFASKKVGKPYLAVCRQGLAHDFVDGTRATGTVKRFEVDVEPGEIVHFRGAEWSREAGAYEADEAYALVLDDGLYQLDRRTALEYDQQRQAGWRAVRRADAHEQGTLRLIVQRDDQEADYVLAQPAVLIADALARAGDADSEIASPVLTCRRV